jgi:dynamin family protein
VNQPTAPASPDSSAHAQVTALCSLARQLTEGTELATEVAALQQRLAGPLRVAIAGRVKAGKSTLLNALIGERLAPTDAGECTRIVTVYSEGLGYEVRAILRNGDAEPLTFRRDGALEIDLGLLRPEEVERLEVSWPSATLRRMTLIDTPGLASINDENSVRTRDFLALDEDRPSQADAVIYLMRHLHRTDADFLDTFLDRSVGQVSPVNAVVVLSRADEIGASRLDAMESAKRIAARYRANEQLRTLCATVLPIAGLLAETGMTLTEAEVALLRRLAVLPRTELAGSLLSADRFTAATTGLSEPEGSRALLRRLGMFGVRLALTEMRAGRATTGPEVASLLVRSSGIDDLRLVLLDHFLPRARVLQARAALSELRSVARRLASVEVDASARLDVEAERIEASAHDFAELRLAHLVMTESIRLTASDAAEIRRLTAAAVSLADRLGVDSGAPSQVLQHAALEGAERWRARAEDPLADRLDAHAAEIAARSYEGLYLAAQATVST